MKISIFSNIPSPYRIEFFNLLGKKVDLKVVFEAEIAPKINTKWYSANIFSDFDSVFLKKGVIDEKKINWKILKYVNHKDSDLLIFTNYSYYTEMIGLIYAKIKRIKYCLMIDGGFISYDESFFKRILKKFLISGAILYMSPSKETDNFLEFYGAKKEGIKRYPFTSLKDADILNKPISKYEKRKLKNQNAIYEDKVILSIGQFIYRKGFDWMIETYKKLPSNIGVYIVGGEPTKEYLNLKKKYKMNNLHFIAFQNKEQIINWYRLADLFVLPTREDIWGLVINEAMSQGLPVITTDKCMAGLELIEDYKNGFIVDLLDYEKLYNKSIYLLNCDNYNISINNISKIKSYSLEKMSEAIYNIIEDYYDIL